MALAVACRGCVPLTLPRASLERLPLDSPLRHILLGTTDGLQSSSSIDVAPEVLQCALLWGGISGGDDAPTAVARAALLRLQSELLDEAAAFADYVCLPEMRTAAQKQMLRAKIHTARETRLTDRSESVDVLPGLLAFAKSARDFTVMQGLGPQEQAVVHDQARYVPVLHAPRLPRAHLAPNASRSIASAAPQASGAFSPHHR